VKQFENNIISVNPIKKTNASASIKPITQQNQALKKVIEEIKVYTEEEHIAYATEEIAELYVKFRDAILNLADGIEIKPQKLYIAFKKDNNIACVEIQKKKIKIHIGARVGALDDARKLAKDVSNIGHYGTGDYELDVANDKDLEYIMSLIKQVI